MTERLAIKYSLDAYKAAREAGKENSAATAAAMAKFRSFYPSADEGEIRAKLARALAEERMRNQQSEPSSA